MFNLISKIKVWYVSRRYPDLRNHFKNALFRESHPRSDLSYNEYIRSLFEPVSKSVDKEVTK